MSKIDKAPVLNFSTSKIIELRRAKDRLQQFCNSAFSGNDDWRAKGSLQKKLSVMQQTIQTEKQKIRQQFEQDVKVYEQYQKDMKDAEEKLKIQGPINAISLSDPIANSKHKEIKENPILGLEII